MLTAKVRQALPDDPKRAEEAFADCLSNWSGSRRRGPKTVHEKSRSYRKRLRHAGIKIATKGRPLPGTFASGWKHRWMGDGTEWPLTEIGR